MAEQAASVGVIDFTNVKDGGDIFNKKRQKEGDYKAKITKVVDRPSKKDGVAQWLFTIQVGSGTYPYYCKHEENQYWKIRNLLVAAGMNVPKKKVKVDPNKLVGKWIAVTLEDDEYDGKPQSNIASTFPVSELDDEDTPDEDDSTEDDDDDDDDSPPPPKKKAPAASDDDDDDDDDDTPPPPKKSKPAPVEEDDDDDEPAPPPKKAKAPAPADDDDDLEEIDIDDT